MAHIVYIHQYFKTPAEGGSIRSWYIARAMLQAGHEVSMLTAWNKPSYALQIVDGITVHYLPVRYEQSMNSYRRMLAFWQFARAATNLGKTLPAPDCIYATSTPLSVGIPAMRLQQHWDVPMLFEVRDLWPEAPIALGVIKAPWLKYLFRRLERAIYQSAHSVVALSPAMAAGVRRVNTSVPVLTVPNMADTDFFGEANKPVEPGTVFNRERPLKIAYTGAAGYSNELSYVKELALQVADLPVEFHLMALGAELREAQQATKDFATVHWHPYGSKEKVRWLLGECVLSLVMFRDNTILQSNSPNKFFDALAAGKAILVNIPGWVAELVEEHACGFYVARQNPERFRDVVLQLLKEPERLARAQAAAFALGNEEFAVVKLCQLVLSQVDAALLDTR